MKDRRGFLKLLGIGAGAVAAGVLAMVAGTPTPAPRTIQDIEAPKPFIGPPFPAPEGDFIKERPPVVPDAVIAPPLTPDQYNWVVDGTKVITFDFDFDWDDVHLEPGALIPTVDPNIELIHTIGTYDHNLGGYSLENTWTDYEG